MSAGLHMPEGKGGGGWRPQTQGPPWRGPGCLLGQSLGSAAESTRPRPPSLQAIMDLGAEG